MNFSLQLAQRVVQGGSEAGHVTGPPGMGEERWEERPPPPEAPHLKQHQRDLLETTTPGHHNGKTNLF